MINQVKIGGFLRELRKEKELTQEQLAEKFGVSSRSVSRWENGNTMPDVTMIPAIASFFGVSTDELFDFNLFETEKQVTEICDEAFRYRSSDPTKAEEILRGGLQRFPGNDRLLNNLLYTLDMQSRTDEVINLCRALIESTRDVVRAIIASYDRIEGSDWPSIKNRIKDELHRFIYEKIKRNPMILPIIVDLG